MSFSRLLYGILHPPFVYSSKSVRQVFFRLQESKFACSKYKTNFEVYNFEPTKVAIRRQGNSPLIIPLRLLRSEARMAKLATPVGEQKSLANSNEEGVVSSSSGFLSGDEEAVVTTKGKGRGRKAKKEVIKEVDTASPQKAEKTVKAAGTGRGRKKVSNEEQTNAANSVNSLDNEVKVQKKTAAAAKGRGKKAAAASPTKDITQAMESINEEAAGSLPPVKRGRKAASTKIVENLNENNVSEVVDVVPALKGRGRDKKVTAIPAVNDEESTEVQPIAEEASSTSKRQKKSSKSIPKDEEKQSDEAVEIVKEDKKRKTTKSTKVKAEPIEPTDEPEPIVDAKKTKARGRQPKQEQKEEIESTNEPVAEAIVEAKKTKPRARQPKQVQKEEIVTDLLEKSTEKPPKGKAATKRKATNKEPVADDLIEHNAEDLKVEADEEDSKPTAKKKAKKEPKEKKLAKETKPKARAAKAQEKNEDEELENGITVEDKKPKGRKRAAVAADEDETDGAKPTKAKKAPLMNSTATKYNKEDFILPLNEDGVERFNLRIASWNVAGLRSWLKKDGLRYLEYELPDIFCLQEIKCTIDQLPEEVARIPGYHPYWLCMPGGYAGVAIYSKIMPINVVYGIDNEEFDGAGRMITAEYEKFFLINVYVPNSGRKLVNLEARMRWEKLFQDYAKRLDAIKPVVICGDMNVSHQAIDLANPKTNTRSAGFTQEERDKMTELLSLGFVDTFRHLYPDRIGAYTYWTYMANARSRNVGWRLDYYIVSERFTKRVVDNCIRAQVMGSDHCPITLFLKI